MATTDPEWNNVKELPSLSPAQRQVAGVLAEVHGATIVEITAVVGVSKSTVAKTLTLLEAAGAAQRTVHTDGEIRMADTWSPTPLTGTVLIAAASGDRPGYGHAEKLLTLTHSEDVRPETDVKKELGGRDGTVEEAALDESDGTEPPHTTRREPIEQAVASANGNAGAGDAEPALTGGTPERLATGELAEMVAAALAARPDVDYSPTMLSHLLGGRSSGAIANALERMVAKGAAVRTCEAPKRYRVAPSTTPVC